MVALSGSAFAQSSGQAESAIAQPSDPAAASTNLRYVSIFENYKLDTGQSETPDKIWRKANDEVGSSNDSSMKMGGSQTHDSMSSAAPVKSSTTTAMPGDSHKGHNVNQTQGAK